MKLYVGNLSYDTQEEELRGVFEKVGSVSSVDIIKDRDTGRSKGFGFVEMEQQNDGENAIKQLNDTEFKGRKLNVSVARPPKDRDNSSRRFTKRY